MCEESIREKFENWYKNKYTAYHHDFVRHIDKDVSERWLGKYLIDDIQHSWEAYFEAHMDDSGWEKSYVILTPGYSGFPNAYEFTEPVAYMFDKAKELSDLGQKVHFKVSMEKYFFPEDVAKILRGEMELP